MSDEIKRNDQYPRAPECQHGQIIGHCRWCACIAKDAELSALRARVEELTKINAELAAVARAADLNLYCCVHEGHRLGSEKRQCVEDQRYDYLDAALAALSPAARAKIGGTQ